MPEKGLVYLITADSMGRGDESLGRVLMQKFLATIADRPEVPEAVIFINGGVFLTTEGTPVMEPLKDLESRGSAVLSCGTCLEFFNLRDKITAGKPSNMHEIAAYLSTNNAIVL